MNGATSEVELVFDEVHPKVFNTMYDIQPLVLHGNGPSKRVLNTLTNYVPKGQLISKCLYFIVSTKQPMQFFQGFLP